MGGTFKEKNLKQTKKKQNKMCNKSSGSSENVNILDYVSSQKKKINKETSVNKELNTFGKYIASELGSYSNKMAIEWAKFEINKVLFKLSCGHYDPSIVLQEIL